MAGLENTSQRPTDWTRSPVRMLTGVAIVSLAAAAALQSQADRRPHAATTGLETLPERRIEINSACVDELQLLPGIGPALASRIVEDRDANGFFESIEALSRVRGVGPRTVLNISEHAAAKPGPDPPASPESPDEKTQARPAEPPENSAESLTQPVAVWDM